MSTPRVGLVTSQRRKRDKSVALLVVPFIEQIGETSLIVIVAIGMTTGTSCKRSSSACGRRESRGRGTNWWNKKFKAEMRLCLKIKDAGPDVKATGSNTGKRWGDARRMKIRAWCRRRA